MRCSTACIPAIKEPTGPDMLAFHEAFADIVALFQHFTIPAVLRAAIRDARRPCRPVRANSPIWPSSSAMPSAGTAVPCAAPSAAQPKADDYTERRRSPTTRGALLVAAVFAAFHRVYDRRTRDLFRLATGGTGVLPEGDIPHDLADRLADEAAAIAG